MPAVARRPAMLLATAVGMLAFGLGPAMAVPTLDDPTPTGGGCTPAPSGKPPILRHTPAAALTPSTRRVVLLAGRSTTVRLRLYQPAQELDAFFLEDNGTKSEFTHCAFQGGLLWAASQLASERNIRVGLGNYGDYVGYETLPSGSSGFDSAQGNEGVYFLDSKVRRPDHTFFADVLGLGSAWTGGWHSTSGDQANLEALYQVVTGAGQGLTPANPDYIPGGASAGFNYDAFPVVVMLAAQWFDTPTRTAGYPGPSFATVEAALHEHGVNLAGVWLDNRKNKEGNAGAPYDGFADLRTLVADGGTRTAVPLRCGGGRPASPAGGLPLCVYTAQSDTNGVSDISGSPKQLGPLLTNLVGSLANPQPVSVSLLSGGSVVRRVVGGQRPGVNILTAHAFDATVAISCPKRLAGHTVPVQLAELVAGQQRADTALSVTCRRPKSPPPPAVAAPIFAAFSPPDPPGKAAVITQAPPNPAPGPQVQPQPLPQQVPQGAIAAGFGEQPEMVASYARIPGQPADIDKMLFGAMAMTALAGAAVRWRSRSRVQHARC